ncbi:MAG: YfhO family protein [bacterium]|nr:YfhO family protein [bacterium]
MAKGKTKAAKKGKPKQERHPSEFPSYDSKLVEFFDKKWVIPLVFLLLSFIFFSNLFFEDVALFTSDGGPTGTKGDAESYWADNPFAEHILWRNLSLGGYPSDQDMMPYFMRIIMSIFFMLGFAESVYAIFAVILTFIAGISMYMYLRVLNIKKMTAMVGGIFYMFAPMMLSFIYAGHFTKMSVIALMPLLFYCLEQGFSTRKFRYYILLGGMMAVIISTSHLQYAYFSFWAIGFYFIYKVISEFLTERSAKLLIRNTALFTFAVVLGLTIASRAFVPQYWHTVNYSKRSAGSVQSNTEQRTEDERFTFSSSYPLNPEEAVTILLPNFTNYFNEYWGRNYLKLNSEYFGAIPLVMFFAALFLWRKEKIVRFFAFLFAFAFLFSLGAHTPFFKFMYYIIPGIKSLRGPSMICFLFSFAATVMMAIVLNKIFDRSDKEDEDSLIKITNITLGVFAGIGLLFFMIPGKILSAWRSVFDLETVWGQNYAPTFLQRMNANADAISSNAIILLIMIGLIFLLIWAYRKKSVGIGLAVIIISAVAVWDTWRIDKDFINTVPRNQVPEDWYVKIPAIENMREMDTSPYRMIIENYATDRKFYYPTIALPIGFSDFTIQRYDFIQNLFLSNVSQRGQITQDIFMILNLLNVKYYLSTNDYNVPFLELVTSDNQFKVYRNEQALPYYDVVYQYNVVQDPNAVLQSLLNRGFDGRKMVVLEKSIPLEIGGSATDEQLGSVVEEIDFLDSEDFYDGKKSKFTFRVRTSMPGFFVLSDNYHPNWEVTVDGEVKELYRANYLWKGVFLEAGEHDVVFQFRPDVLLASRKISGFGILAFFVLLGVSMFIEKREKLPKPEENKD